MHKIHTKGEINTFLKKEEKAGVTLAGIYHVLLVTARVKQIHTNIQ